MAGDIGDDHGDWRIENLGVTDGHLVAVYDWDSVHVERESVALASAASTSPALRTRRFRGRSWRRARTATGGWRS